MATLSGGDIRALVCSTWNIQEASERPAYPGGPFRSQAARGTTRIRGLSQPGPSPAMERPAVAWRAPILPPRTGLQPAATTYTRRPPPPAIWRPTAFPPDIATLGVFRAETDSGGRWR